MTLVVMAAGIGSRFGGIKQIAKVGDNGEIIIDYSVYDAVRAGFSKVVFVIRQDIEKDFCELFFSRLKERIGDKVELKYVFQEKPKWREKPLGTLDALLSAKREINSQFCVINADDFYGSNSFEIATGVKGNAVIVYDLVNTLSDNGVVTRGIVEIDVDGNLFDVTEHYNIDKENMNKRFEPGTKANVNFFVLQPQVLTLLQEIHDEFLNNLGNDQKAESFMPSAIGRLIKQGEIQVKVIQSNDKWLGVTYRDDKDVVINQIKEYTSQGIYSSPLWKELV